MEPTILTADQQKVLRLLTQKEGLRKMFYLTGGTALAGFYLYHRYSDDLDFFTDAQDFPQLAVEGFTQDIKKEVLAEEIEYKRLYDRRIFFFKKGSEELKVEFTQYPFKQINPSLDKNGCLVDSLEDISANKLMALIDRIEVKDFVDLYFIFKKENVTLPKLLELVNKKFNYKIDPVTLGSEFSKVQALKEVPRMIEKISLEELKLFFSDLAKELKPQILEG